MIRFKCCLVCLFAFLIAIFSLKKLVISFKRENDLVYDAELAEILDDSAKEKKLFNYLDDSDDHLFWFVQISDLHLSLFHDKSRIEDFEYFCKDLIGLIKPKVVLASGDLTDAKYKNFIGSRQFEFEWKTYNKVIKSYIDRNSTTWLDVRGNHDNFDVPHRESPSNFFREFGMMNHHERSYMHDVKLPNGDKYSFIAVDACIEPGPRRPFNFFGNLYQQDLDLLKKFSADSHDSNGTIWFGHYPTSTIASPSNIRNIMKNGVAYLCGHLHDFRGLMKSMYTRHSSGLLELELSDFKDNRMFRILAFDAGLLSFKDIKITRNPNKDNLFVLITNPKNVQFKAGNKREPLKRMRYSTHIRFLVFSKHPILSAKVYIDDHFIGDARKSSSNNALFIKEWNPFYYSNGMHKISIVVQDDFKNIEIATQEFSLDNSFKSFKLLSNLILLGDHIAFTKTFFFSLDITILLILIFFRYNHRRFTVNFVSCGFIRTHVTRYLRRLAWLTSISYIYWSIMFMTLYVAIGPWFFGEMLDNHIGICFVWGIYVKNTFLGVDFQYVIGTLHLIFFQCLLIIHLSYKIETRIYRLGAIDQKHYEQLNNSIFSSSKISNYLQSINGNNILHILLKFVLFFVLVISYLWENVSFVFVLLYSAWQAYDLYLSYTLLAVILCPLNNWFLFLAFYLRYKCSNLSIRDLQSFNTTSNTTNFNENYLNLNCLIDKSIPKTSKSQTDIKDMTISEN